MKKILLVILTVLASVTLLIKTPSAKAALIEQTMDFSLLSSEVIPGQSSYIKINTGENLYDKLDAFFDWGQEYDNQGDPFYLTIKNGPLTYEGRVSHRYHITWDVYIFTIGIKFDSGTTPWRSFMVYPEDVVLTSYNIPISTTQSLTNDSSGVPFHTWMLGDYTLHAMLDSEINDEDGQDVSNNFNLLPNTVGTLKDAKDSSKVGYVYFEYAQDNLFDTYVIVAGSQYNLGQLELPGVTELNKMPLSPGIYWTENNKRHIYYEFQQPPSEVPLNEQVNMFISDPDQITGFRPFVTMNLTDSTYTFTHKLKLYAGYYGGPNAQAFADVVFPFELDDLLSIEFNYSYRWENWWGLSYTPWKETNITRYINEPVLMINTWQAIKTVMNPLSIFDAVENVNSWLDYSINKITPTTQYKADYTTHINRIRTEQGKTQLSQAQIFPTGSDVYRVYLNTFYDNRYTGYEIHDDIIIMDVMYQVDGQIYHVSYEDIEQGGSFGGGGPGLGGQDAPEWNWNWLTSLFDNIPPQYILIGLVVLLVLFWKPIKQVFRNISNLIKNPKDLILLGIILAVVMYFLGYL